MVNDIDEIQAGREMDRAIAEKLFGWTFLRRECGVERRNAGAAYTITPFDSSGREGWTRYYYANGTATGLSSGPVNGDVARLPEFSTSIADAWLVVEKMESLGWSAVITTNACSNGKQNGCKFFEGWRGLGHNIYDAEDHEGFDAVEDTTPLAICKAALNALAAQQRAGGTT